jgi:RNA polymerase sigma factor (sigma-70 family)
VWVDGEVALSLLEDGLLDQMVISASRYLDFAAAEDVASETAMKLFLRFHLKRQDLPNPHGYFRRTAINAAKDELKRREQGKTDFLDDLAEAEAEEKGWQSAPSEAIELMGWGACFRSLSPTTQHVLLLRGYYGLPDDDVGVAAGVSGRQVRRIYTAGIQRLRACLSRGEEA